MLFSCPWLRCNHNAQVCTMRVSHDMTHTADSITRPIDQQNNLTFSVKLFSSWIPLREWWEGLGPASHQLRDYPCSPIVHRGAIVHDEAVHIACVFRICVVLLYTRQTGRNSGCWSICRCASCPIRADKRKPRLWVVVTIALPEPMGSMYSSTVCLIEHPQGKVWSVPNEKWAMFETLSPLVHFQWPTAEFGWISSS